jgi:16S rRNA (uracil1498-N3)-methyltransferase
MTRRRFYAPPAAFTADRTAVKLNADETQHLRKVLRLKPGDEVFVFDGAGREFRGEIQSPVRETTQVRITAELAPASTESLMNLTIAVALLKGEKFDLIVQKLTELGINRVIPVITARADVRLRSEADAARRTDRWRRVAMEATKQCGRTRLMTIESPIGLGPFIAKPPASGEQRLMFAERDGSSFAQVIDETQNSGEVVTALVGSEGGWADEEIDHARAAGWKVVTLRGRIMRAETAAIVVAALLQHRFGDLR